MLPFQNWWSVPLNDCYSVLSEKCATTPSTQQVDILFELIYDTSDALDKEEAYNFFSSVSSLTLPSLSSFIFSSGSI